MSRYHFDLVNSKTVSDEGGTELSGDIEAMDVAEELARRLVREHPELKGRHYFILVTNEDGEEIGRWTGLPSMSVIVSTSSLTSKS